MADIQELLESQEMRDAVTAINKLIYKSRSGLEYEENRDFPIALCLVGNYKCDKILQLMMDNKNYYKPYKDVISASFAGWLIDRKSKKVRETLMINAAAMHMANAEFVVATNGTLTIQQDIISRYLIMGIDFLIEIYDCLGGSRAFSDAASFEEQWAAFDGIEKVIKTAAKAVAFLHHAVDRFGRLDADFTPSLNKAVLIFEELRNPRRAYPAKEKYVSRSLLHERWSNNKQTLAMLYAASTIRVNRKSLLQILLDGFFSYEHHGKYLELWVQRTRYVAKHIFARMNDRKLELKTLQLVGEGPFSEFPAPKLDEEEQDSFNMIFRNKIR